MGIFIYRMTLYFFIQEENLIQIIPIPQNLVLCSLYRRFPILAMTPFTENRFSIKINKNYPSIP